MAALSGTLVHSLGHNTLGKTDIAVQSVLLLIAFLIVGLRLWSRRLQRVSLQLNDFLIIVATFLLVGRYVVEILLIVLCGMGLHSIEVAQVAGTEVFVRFNKLIYAGDLLWVVVIALIQLSILHYYVRNFEQFAVILLSYGLMFLCSALCIAGLFATAFLCTPPKRAWLTNTPGYCGDHETLNIGVNASETILSFLVLILPIPLLWRMPLSWARRTALGCVQILGLAIITIIAIRLTPGFEVDPHDLTHSSARKSILSCIILPLGIIAASLPIPQSPVERNRLSAFPSAFHPSISELNFARYWRTTVISGRQLDEPEMPLVTVAKPFMAKMGYLAPGHIQVTSDWEIHSSRGSARFDKSPVRRV
ncbi:hypothetical protein N7457_005401 [Penicillium paradoxum]|uniref:uncharacterized protein n=1 Tax=Penicillium paradoxum TaxID=176176 RepID=UPI0025466493|nr:uncharacterized protein N7457_005401 [Penicillium paradoxum]KAJ5780241.1 hypothetical protein N7457_005401 [Penicillium paradoxum]